jgi:hypothetical protein
MEVKYCDVSRQNDLEEYALKSIAENTYHLSVYDHQRPSKFLGWFSTFLCTVRSE